MTWHTVVAQNGLVYVDGTFSASPLALKSKPSPECYRPSTLGFQCPKAWSSLYDEEGVVCLWLSQEPLSQANASTACQDIGGELVAIQSWERQATIARFVEEVDGEIWTSAFKPVESHSFLWHGKDFLSYKHAGQYEYSDLFYARVCIYMTDSYERNWADTDLCNDRKRFVCTMEPACMPGRFGQHCQSECHCLGEPCQGEQPCSSGCEMGWSGPHCCLKRALADVAYYCVKDGRKRYMELRVDPKNTDYELMQAVDKGGQSRPWCSNIYVTTDPHTYTYTIRVPVEEEEEWEDEGGNDYNVTCGREKTGNNTFTWRIALQERSDLRLPLDRTFLITCDFDNAETLSRQLTYDVKLEEERETDDSVNPVETLLERKEDVSLDVVVPHTGDVIHQAVLGTTVELRMRLTVAGKLTAQGVSPFDCEASTPGREFTQRLTFYSGCPILPAVVSSLKGSNGTVTSDPFMLFTFPGHQLIIITCHFKFCFTASQLPTCDDRCAQMGINQRKRKKRSADDKPEFVSTQIRILPDVETKPTNTHMSNGNHFDAANMMTPVTWILVAVLLVMSAVLLYVLYFRATKRTIGVPHIR